ncbi:hypothetical protein [Spongiactinospora sp. TRM90649]|uniref:hypothetical protein n=1 Tax=Spongiactinospora sp. TRM90649 TaxID=3031114 RepID=UPI0023F6997C|nr:hypothetical protein [Spongiactinospora sp. TRM90649]MDF5758765.1 hypothetical protein [Spongiactinospora sp. TRM90649]
MTAQQTAWPDGVIARFLTVGGATVDLTEHADAECPAASRTVPRCAGCGTQRDFDWLRETWESTAVRYIDTHRHEAAQHARNWAQEHAERCRAMPRPTP